MGNEIKSFVKDYMTKNVITVREDTPNEQVIKTMKKTKHDGYPVVDEDDKIVGIVTAFDLLLKEWGNGHIEDVMSMLIHIFRRLLKSWKTI
mgnify:FL=1